MSHRHLILGLLSESPMSGYDIKKRLGESMSMIASISYGAVYPTLHRLLEEKAVTVREIAQDGKPAKKIYNITEKGREELDRWLYEPASPDRIKREFLLKLLLAHRMDAQAAVQLVAKRREETEALSRKLEHIGPTQQVNGNHKWVIAYAQALCEAEMRWLDRIDQALQTGEI